jgi:probable rRNA maturation factor
VPARSDYDIDLSIDEPYAALGLDRWMPAVARRVLVSEEIEGGGSLSIVVTDDETVHELNRDFRGYDQPTDVLSFGLSDLARPATDDEEPFPDFVLPPDSASQLGEVVIAFPTAERQAAEHGRTTTVELAHLLIHGVLHLLGYDHYAPDEEREMRSREERLLAERNWEQLERP